MTTDPSPQSPPPLQTGSDADAEADTSPICVMAFNASDPSGAGGLTGDIATIASVGGHAVAIVTGAYVRDTAQVFDHYPLDDEAVAEQARTVLEDLTVQAIKVGFVGSPENLAAIASIASDYDDVPVIAYMPDLSWWQDDLIDQYLDAFQEMLLPLTSVLVGNYSTLCRWLLPEWSSDRKPSARDLAMTASELGVPYLLVTGIPAPEQHVENVLTSAQSVLGTTRFELFEATFAGAGDTLSAALTALVASGNDLGEAASEALTYLDHCLDAGFRPGMGQFLPDRMFWAQPDDDDDEDSDDEPPVDPTATDGFVMPPHDTQH
ncbi:bifunctional hydroxymethylpyrimidine kinase/phosphomethylpyrimidine kinase [Paracidovorax konjaci]|uniref:Hydroxymethylpyrimidine/phosphomethylpyrimidine kinase n=1 Tax=Paracidovorax konjaci TaxID=32040 RepID=A0A1I1VPR3_9BURK|nr:bifunctional hydroxymethylpyrimidine kinase/phosphomethylpyrimidine kinase [Paracidovorax konjaci]SFD84825.1 hydroxymethylpyrimidine/phosphomethylpyrimidine kinase [Paracidovorax konjaci]